MGNPFLSPFITSFTTVKDPLFWRVVIVDDLDGGGLKCGSGEKNNLQIRS